MQVERMKSKLKAHGIKRLKVKYDILLSRFAFNVILRRYKVGDALYLPAYWWHAVRAGAPGRNLAVNFWYPTVSAVLRLVMDGMEGDAF